MSSSTKDQRRRLVLVGNPNVGKSVIFRLLTGNYVMVSNFPGTTVEVSRGQFDLGGTRYEVVDTPGINSLVPQSEDEQVTCEILLEEHPDVIIQVADAKNLRRTLLVTSQLAEFGMPMVLVLNMMDEAQERGITIDSAGLSGLFGIPVVETVAIYSRGRRQLQQAIQSASVPKDIQRGALPSALRSLPAKPGVPTSLLVEWKGARNARLLAAVENGGGKQIAAALQGLETRDDGKTFRALARDVAERRNGFAEESAERHRKKREAQYVDAGESGPMKFWLGALAVGLLLLLWNEFGGVLGIPTPFSVSMHLLARVGAALGLDSSSVLFRILMAQGRLRAYEFGLVTELVHLFWFILPVVLPLAVLLRRNRSFTGELGILTRRASTGIPILLIVLLLVYEFVGYTGAQTLVGLLEEVLFGQAIIPSLRRILPQGLTAEFLIGRYGMISMGLTYAIAIVLPVVGTFFIAFGLLEDSGYLPRLSILTDRVMRSMGLNGKATLPMVLGLGCCTMATITTRILSSSKERIIATLLLALGIPCSAQLGVILGISAGYSAAATITVIGVVLSQLFLVGYLASLIVKGERSLFLFEIPPIRVPQMRNVLMKTRLRIRWYLFEAVPLFLYGTLALFTMDKLKVDGRSLLEWVEIGMKPVVTGLLHLPQQAAPVFVLGFLRRDYGAAGLFDLAHSGLLSGPQVVVSLVVITLFVPCVASFLVMAREQGLRRALAITGFIVPFAITVGTIVSWVLRTFSITFQ